MDPNLHAALLFATRDDLERDEVEPHERAALELGPAHNARPDLVWNDDYPDEEERIRSLEGIQAYPSFETVDLLASCLEDLGPLLALTRVSALRITVTELANLDVLAELSTLRRVAVHSDVLLSNKQHQSLAALAARGVLVDDTSPDFEELSRPFADQNLRLAVVNHVHGDRLPRSLLTFDEYALDKANLARMLALPVSDDDLASIDTLVWDEGGLSIHHLVYSQWDGEDSTFAIQTLEGIEHLRNLKRLACYTKELPAAEVEALQARGVVVHHDPFPKW